MPDKETTQVLPANEHTGGETSTDVQRVALVSSSPSARSIVRVVLIVLALLAVKDILVFMLTSLTYLLFMVVLAILLAYLINPLVKTIHRPFQQGRFAGAMPRPVAIALAFLLVFGVLAVGIGLLSPRVSEQARTFAANIPTYTSDLQSSITDLNRRLDRMRISDSIQTQVNEGINRALDSIGIGVTNFFSAAAVFLTYLPWLILIPILSFFFLKDAQFFRLGLLRMFPVGEWRSRMDLILGDINDTLTAYTRAQLISCLWVGIACTIGFY